MLFLFFRCFTIQYAPIFCELHLKICLFKSQALETKKKKFGSIVQCGHFVAPHFDLPLQSRRVKLNEDKDSVAVKKRPS